jgi:hypothetical protein
MIEQYYNLVEDSISLLGINAKETRGEQAGQWNLKKGNFDIMIDVWEQEKIFLFQVVSPLCSLPDENKEEFFLYLLKRNYGLSGTTYAIMENDVFLKYTTEANLLTKESILNILTKTAFYAEQSDFVPHD